MIPPKNTMECQHGGKMWTASKVSEPFPPEMHTPLALKMGPRTSADGTDLPDLFILEPRADLFTQDAAA